MRVPVIKILLRLTAVLLISFSLAACESVEERIAKHYERGQDLVERGEPEKAVLEFRNVLKLNGDHVGAQYAIGLIDEDNRELSNAFSRFLRVTELDPTHVRARVKVARMYLLRGDVEKAREHVDVALEVAPDDVDVLAMHARVLLRERKLATAREVLDKALSIAPDNIGLAVSEVEYLRRAKSETLALARAEKTLKRDPENILLNLAKLQILAAMKDTLALGAQLERLIELDIDPLRFRDLLAKWAIDQKQYDLAEEQLRYLADAKIEDRVSVYRLIRFMQQVKGPEAARAELERIIGISEGKVKVRNELMLTRLDRDTGARDSAMKYLEGMIARNDDSSNAARVEYANVLFDEGKSAEGLAMTGEVLKADPNNVEALVIWGAHLINEGELDKAVQSIRLGLNEEPDDIRLLTLAGRAQERLGNINLASDRLARAMRSSKFATVNVKNYVDFLTRIERFGAAEAVLTETVRRRPEEPLFVENLGFVRLRLGDVKGAEQAARLLEARKPGGGQRLTAAILFAQEKFDEGAGMLRTLTVDDTQRMIANATIMQAYLRNGDTAAAGAFVEDLLAKNPNDPQALGLKGNLLFAAGDLDGAEAYYRKVIEIAPKSGGARSALMRLNASRGDMKAAETSLTDGLSLAPKNLLLKTRLAQLRETQGKIDDAIALYEEVYAAAPNALLVANNYASLLADYHSDDPKLVDKAYRMAGRLKNSSFPHYQDTYAWTRYLKGENKEALKAMKKVMTSLPDNPWTVYHLAMIQYALDDVENARANLQKVLDLIGDAQDFAPRRRVERTLAEINKT